MKYFEHKSKKLSKIGIGTWGIGGYMERDHTIDAKKQKNALIYMLQNGFNYVEANMWYSEGYSAEILANAIKESKVDRDKIFICQAIYLKDGKDFDSSISEVDAFCKIADTDYVDSIQFSAGSFARSSFEEISDWVESQIEKGKSKYTSITNQDIKLFEKYHERFGDKLFAHEVPYNFEIIVSETEGLIPYATKNDILTVVYQPLRRNNTAKRNWPVIVELADKYNKTQNQIILNWITNKGYLPLTKSETAAHIDEHIASVEFEMEAQDYEKLDNFQVPNVEKLKIDWDRTGNGYSLDQLSNVYDQP